MPRFDALEPFVHELHTPRVVFGSGALAQLADEVGRLGVRRALVLCTPEQRPLAERAAALLGERSAGVHPGAVMHVPIEAAREARALARERGADGVVAIGGGSTTGLGKAIALESELPVIAVPTTYAGSEMTPIWGLTEGGEKRTGRDRRVLPRVALYDPALTLTLPLGLSIASGLNAIAHAAEGLYAHDASPIHRRLAEDGIAAMAGALPRLAVRADDPDARAAALAGAWLCGTVLGNVSMGLHHKLCHTLGGSFGLPHAEVHAVILPHAMAYNAAAAPQAMAALARALGREGEAQDSAVQAGPRGLHDLARTLGAPTSLRAIGMPADGLDRAADLAAARPYPNPRPLDRDALRALLERAWHGDAPA